MPLFTSYILRIVYEKDNERSTARVMAQAIGAEELSCLQALLNCKEKEST